MFPAKASAYERLSLNFKGTDAAAEDGAIIKDSLLYPILALTEGLLTICFPNLLQLTLSLKLPNQIPLRNFKLSSILKSKIILTKPKRHPFLFCFCAIYILITSPESRNFFFRTLVCIQSTFQIKVLCRVLGRDMVYVVLLR
jgi:hypothetical protein